MADLTFSVVVRWAMVGVVGMEAAAAVVRRRPPAMKGVSLLGVDEVDEVVVKARVALAGDARFETVSTFW
jgi:hypothetical protein